MDEPVTPILDPPKRGEGAAHPLAAWRERRGLSQKRFGAMARTAASTISRIENKKMRPKPELLGACPSSRWSSCGESDSLLVDEQGISPLED